MDTKIFPPVRKKVMVSIVTGTDGTDLQNAINDELDSIFSQPEVFDIIDIKYNVAGEFTASIHFYEAFSFTPDAP